VKSSYFKRLKQQHRKRRRSKRRLKYYTKLYRTGGILLDATATNFIKEIDQYWNLHYGTTINPLWHLAYAQVTGRKDPRYISSEIWWEEILPHFNDLELRPAFRDKNLSDLFLPQAPIPNTIIKRIHSHYYTADNHLIAVTDAEQLLCQAQHTLIIKPSQTDDGYGIAELVSSKGRFLLDQSPCTFEDLEQKYGKNFIVQEKIIQHPILAAPHPSSVNTIRVVSFRWRGEIKILLAFVRFGINGKLTDNVGTGGLCCGIDSSGRLQALAVDRAGKTYARHPTSNYDFGQQKEIPDFHAVCTLAVNLHHNIYPFDIISWDFALDIYSKPLFLELNFRGAVDVYQFASGKPLFGNLTEEVLDEIRKRPTQLS
jgi:hypothetical protein